MKAKQLLSNLSSSFRSFFGTIDSVSQKIGTGFVKAIQANKNTGLLITALTISTLVILVVVLQGSSLSKLAQLNLDEYQQETNSNVALHALLSHCKTLLVEAGLVGFHNGDVVFLANNTDDRVMTFDPTTIYPVNCTQVILDHLNSQKEATSKRMIDGFVSINTDGITPGFLESRVNMFHAVLTMIALATAALAITTRFTASHMIKSAEQDNKAIQKVSPLEHIIIHGEEKQSDVDTRSGSGSETSPTDEVVSDDELMSSSPLRRSIPRPTTDGQRLQNRMSPQRRNAMWHARNERQGGIIVNHVSVQPAAPGN